MRGTPKKTIKYGKRTCHFVEKYKSLKDAQRKAFQLNVGGIVTKVNKWYSWWAVYRCGTYKRSRK